jgi:hypothetical protein
MSNGDEDGSAFPYSYEYFDRRNRKVFRREKGMSLRDWFAGMASIGLSQRYDDDPDQVATLAYAVADAMLDNRKEYHLGNSRN